MKTKLDYYQRYSDAHNHPKFKALRAQYRNLDNGWGAEGRFWAINDMIARSEGCKLDVTKLYVKADIADTLGMSFDELDKFLLFLISEKCRLLKEVEPGIYTAEILQENLEIALKERKRAKDRKGTSKSPEIIQSSVENNESSGELVKSSVAKESKEKESKEKEIKENKIKQQKEAEDLNNSPSNILTENYKEKPELMFIRYWNKHGSEHEVALVKNFIKEHGIKKVTYAFHESMEHDAKNIAYVRSILNNLKDKILPSEAKADAERLEKMSIQNKKQEKEQLKQLEAEQKEAEKKMINELWGKYRTFSKEKINDIKLKKLKKNLDENNYMSASLIVAEIEYGIGNEQKTENDKTLKGSYDFQSIGERINKFRFKTY